MNSSPRRVKPIKRRDSLKRLKTLVLHHSPAAAPSRSHDLHQQLFQDRSKEDGFSSDGESSVISDDVSERNRSPVTSRPGSPSVKHTNNNDSNHHHHHHHHHHHSNPKDDQLLQIFQEGRTEKINILQKAIAHFGRSCFSLAINKWREFIKLQIWNNLQIKATNICSGIKTPNELSKKNLAIVMEWINIVCGSLFDKLSKQECLEMVCGSEYHEVADGEPLFFQGDTGKHYWIVLTGEIIITVLHSNIKAKRKSIVYKRRRSWVPSKNKISNQEYDPNDLGETVFRAGPGVGFGQIALISKNPIRSGSCIATKNNTALLGVPKNMYKKYLAHLHEAEKNLDKRIEFFKTLEHFKHWSYARLVHLAYSVREKTVSRGETVLDGSKLVEKSKDENIKNDPSLVLDIIFIKDGSVEYSRYLKDKKNKKNVSKKAQGLAICGPGHMFAAPGGSFCDDGVAESIVITALSKTTVYCISKSYFTNLSNTKRTDMISAKAMFKREESFISNIRTKRAKHIQNGINSEKEVLRMRDPPEPAPKIGNHQSGALEAEHPYPNEGQFLQSPMLTYKRLHNHNPRRLAHMAELSKLDYESINTVPPWATGTPIVRLNQKKISKKLIKQDIATIDKKVNLPNILTPSKSTTPLDQKEKKKSWKIEEPRIVVQTREIFKKFRTKDVDNILMGFKLD
jgi:CRP-like cAMP-binding protein